MKVKEMYFNHLILIFTVAINIYKTEGDPISNVERLAENGNHIKFNHFYRMELEERLLSNDQGGHCGKCQPVSPVHTALNDRREFYQKCHGKLEHCSLMEGEVVNKTDCTSGCSCYCYVDNLDRVESFCLDPVSVNVSQNYAITGVQFVIVNKMVMLQVRQGKPISKENLRRGLSKWLDPPTSCVKTAPISYNDSYFILDKITLRENHVITSIAIRKCQENWEYNGLKIKTLRNCEGDFFFLTAYGTTLSNVMNGIADNFIEGERDGPMSILPPSRVDWSTENMGFPEETKKDQTLKRGNFVKFRSTSLSDGTRIIPYLNAKRITPFSTLNAIELAYYGDETHGGYISPVVYV